MHGILLIPFILVFFIIFILIIYFIATKKIKLKYFMVFVLIVTVVFVIRDRVKNKVFYDFEDDLKAKYSYVSNIEAEKEWFFECHGPHYYITVNLKTDTYSLEQIEPIFIDIICATTDDTIYNYLKERRGDELYYLHIYFSNENDEETYYVFTSFREDGKFSEWWLEETDQYYYLEDYLNN